MEICNDLSTIFRTKSHPGSNFFLQRPTVDTQNYFPEELPSLDLFLILWQGRLFKFLCFLPGEKAKQSRLMILLATAWPRLFLFWEPQVGEFKCPRDTGPDLSLYISVSLNFRICFVPLLIWVLAHLQGLL